MRRLLLLAALGLLAGCDSLETAQGRTLAAKHAARDAVLARIRSPTTARFSQIYTTCDARDQPKVCEVRGDFDAQNDFGALVRSSFFVTMHWGKTTSAPDETWVIDSAAVT